MSLCYFLPHYSVTLVYVHVLNSVPYRDYATRFARTYSACQAGHPHRTVIVCNGGMASDHTKDLFSSIPDCVFFEHDNSGYDIGAYQHAAAKFPCDLMVFFGSSTYFRKPGWLLRYVQAYQKHGDGIYGAMGNRGDIPHNVWPHLRTTAFAMPPDLMSCYPKRVSRPEERYAWEHGKDCITEWVKRQGMVPRVVSFIGEHVWQDWDDFPEGFHRGTQANLLVGDRLCEPPYYPHP